MRTSSRCASSMRLYGNALVSSRQNDAASAPPRLVRRPQASPASDEQDRSVANLSCAQDQRAASTSSHLSQLAAAHGAAGSGLVCGCDLYPDAARLPLPGRHPGVGQPQGAGLAAVEHDGGDFCRRRSEEAIVCHGKSDIFNTDQGGQFTSFAFTTMLKDVGIRISMNGRGRWMDRPERIPALFPSKRQYLQPRVI